MNISEANAVNALLDYLLRPRPKHFGNDQPSQGDVLRAAQTLARGAHKALSAGWSDDDISIQRTRVRVPR